MCVFCVQLRGYMCVSVDVVVFVALCVYMFVCIRVHECVGLSGGCVWSAWLCDCVWVYGLACTCSCMCSCVVAHVDMLCA